LSVPWIEPKKAGRDIMYSASGSAAQAS